MDSPERRIVIVELEKDAEQGIGLTIVGGENTGRLDLGIFVKSIHPGGPAFVNGRSATFPAPLFSRETGC